MLSTLIMRCLAKDSVQRPQTADEILHELDSMTMPIGLTPDGGETRTVSTRRPWIAAAAAAILVAILGGLGYAVVHSRAPVPSPPAVPRSTPPPAPKAPDSASTKMAVVPPKPAKPALSHADSVRIADIVRKRMEAAKVSDSIAKAKLAEQTQRKVMDSIISANSGGAAAPSLGLRRVVVAEAPDQARWPEAALLGRAVADSLRRTLRYRRQQFAVVDQDSVRAVLAKTTGVAEISKALNADLIIAIRLQTLRGDSAVLMLQSYDMTAAGPYRSRTAVGRSAPKTEVLVGLDQVLLSTITYLDEMSRAPRRPATPGTP
jgi:hypothetical protein